MQKLKVYNNDYDNNDNNNKNHDNSDNNQVSVVKSENVKFFLCDDRTLNIS